MPHPQTPCSEGFSLPPTLPRVPLSTSKPLALQPQRAGRGTVRRSYISRRKRPILRQGNACGVHLPRVSCGLSWCFGDKESSSRCRRLRRCVMDPGPERSPGGGNGNLRQYSCLAESHGRRSPTVRGVAESPGTERVSARAHTHTSHTHVPCASAARGPEVA